MAGGGGAGAGLNGFIRTVGLEIAHRAVEGVVARIADRSGVFADMASERVGRVLESANLVAARDETASCRLAACYGAAPDQDDPGAERNGAF